MTRSGLGELRSSSLEHGRHAERVVAGGGHGADADAVGLELLGAGVVDLVLNRGALRAEDRALHDARVAAARGRAEHDGREHGRGREQAGVGLIDHAAHEVTLRDVRGLVREHARRARSRSWSRETSRC